MLFLANFDGNSVCVITSGIQQGSRVVKVPISNQLIVEIFLYMWLVEKWPLELGQVANKVIKVRQVFLHMGEGERVNSC